ncbi:hypothetical protein NQZ79_g3524 [Umbelopsis isabellina]|nr:hypothetical protein NQZ79_g3524 [Umbelopsis isabellina]
MHQAAVRAYSATAGSCPNTYEAQAGDTCSSIATKFNINENDIQTWNPSFSCSSIATNDILCISAPYNSATAPATGASSINTSPTSSATSSSSSAAIPTTHPHGKTLAVKSEKDFCLFLPTKPGQEIQASEKTAHTFCTSHQSTAPGAKIMPKGLILSAHYEYNKTADYVQITGLLNPAAYNMSSHDQGGQFDMRSPKAAVCAGYASFVSLVEPAQGDYCIRCCNTNAKELCNIGRSQDGCWNLVKGNYDGPKIKHASGSKSTTHKTVHHHATAAAPAVSTL